MCQQYYISIRNFAGSTIYETKDYLNVDNLKYIIGYQSGCSPNEVFFSDPEYFDNDKIIINSFIKNSSYEEDTKVCDTMNCKVVTKVQDGQDIEDVQTTNRVSNIVYTNVKDCSMENITNLSGLKSFELYCANVRGLPENIHFLYNLESISIKFCHNFIEQLPNNLSLCLKLKSIIIENCFNLKSSIPSDIGLLPKLETMSFYGCRQLHGRVPKMRTLIAANFNYCKCLSISMNIVKENPWLKILKIDECNVISLEKELSSDCITNLSINNINYYSPSLSLFPILNIKSLVALSLRDVNIYGNIAKIIENLTKLETVDLSHCKNLTGNIFKNIGNFKELSYFDIKNSPLIYGYIPKTIERCSKLTYFNISGCLQIKGDIPAAILNIKRVNISYCPQITGIRGSTQNYEYKINTLDLSHNTAMCFNLAKLKGCHQLDNLNCSHTNVKGKFYRKHWPNLVHINMENTGIIDADNLGK